MNSANLNSVNLIGRLTRDPELRHTQSGKACATFTLAVDRMGSGTDFINIVTWNQTAEFVSRNFVKGLRVAVSGYLRQREWTDRVGTKRDTLEVIANNVYFADGKRQTAESVEPAREPAEFTELDEDEELPF